MRPRVLKLELCVCVCVCVCVRQLFARIKRMRAVLEALT
jgi:hypothetical protein